MGAQGYGKTIMIYHITTLTDWQKARANNSYQADSLKSEGFIHASTRSQVLNTAVLYYRGQHGLVLLFIDEQHVQPEVRYENLEGGSDKFPHIYGPLNLDAVTKAPPFEPRPDGSFIFPENGGLS
jgi:uncharacterized protein (DUF952 family)